MTDTEREYIHTLREEQVDGWLSLLASSAHGPYTGVLTRPGHAQIRVFAGTLAGVFEKLIAEVRA